MDMFSIPSTRSSHSMHNLLSLSPVCTTPSGALSSLGVWRYRIRDKRLNFDIQRRRSAIFKPQPEDHSDYYQHNGLFPTPINWQETAGAVASTVEEAKVTNSNPEFFFGWSKKSSIAEEISNHIKDIKTMLVSMEDGEISVSAYDTAWVAMVEDVEGSGAPQFPSSLEWIANNQLPDGSWGDRYIFQAHDRLMNTLACVIALTSWNLHPEMCEKGMSYFKCNLHKLEGENPEHMPIGFEVAFPSLLEIARTLNINIPDDSSVLKTIHHSRNIKLQSIPKHIMHEVPTTLLFSLEGMPDLDWEKLLKFQSEDGSFLFSPSSTAYALMQTKDQNCFRYLKRVVERFSGGVPNVYPVDLFEHSWAVDRLHRLGISRFFRAEIKECASYVNRYWTENGICWARNSPLSDMDDTTMGFRLLRSNGYDVSPDVFRQFEKDGGFVSFNGQSTEAITAMFNLYRTSQLLFPGETILQNAKEFSSNVLREKQDSNQILDKWIITKDLPGEVKYALEVPLYASLPRVESRFYIEHYGGKDDVWIGKALYRMMYVNNDEYLQLAKLDYNNCQELHHAEWKNFQKWYEEYDLGAFGISKRIILKAYFVATASIFEPERSQERLAWAKTTVLIEIIHSYFHQSNNNMELRRAFVHDFKNGVGLGQPFNGRMTGKKSTRQELITLLIGTINHLSFDALDNGPHISTSLCHAWEKWLIKWEAEGERGNGEAELLIQTLLICAGYGQHWRPLSHHLPEFESLCDLTNELCFQLCNYQSNKAHIDNGSRSDKFTMPESIERGMQKLVQLVYQNSPYGLDPNIKQTFLVVAKSFYYMAYCDPGTIDYHIAKVLFERID